MPEITTEWRRFHELTAGELYELLRFRQSIFVVEQACAYPDLDGLDQSAWHLLAWLETELHHRVMGSADAREGVAAFVDRRTPRWSSSVSAEWVELPDPR